VLAIDTSTKVFTKKNGFPKGQILGKPIAGKIALFFRYLIDI
jgi:hypothetical protein